MKKWIAIFVSIMLLMPLTPIYADDLKEYNPNKPLGDVETIQETLNNAKKRFGILINEPEFLPFSITHSGGTVKNGSATNSFIVELSYLNSETKQLLQIHIFNGDKIKFQSSDKLKLSDGTLAQYAERSPGPHFLRFYRNGLTFIIGLTDIQCPKLELLKTANSMI